MVAAAVMWTPSQKYAAFAAFENGIAASKVTHQSDMAADSMMMRKSFFMAFQISPFPVSPDLMGPYEARRRYMTFGRYQRGEMGYLHCSSSRISPRTTRMAFSQVNPAIFWGMSISRYS